MRLIAANSLKILNILFNGPLDAGAVTE